MRQLIYQTLSQDPTVSGKVGTNIFTPNLLGTAPVSSRPTAPFLILAEQPAFAAQPVRKTSRSYTTEFDIRCYDERGDYLRIDSILRASREALLALPVPAVSPSGAKAIDIRWMGTGLDSEDPDLDMILKSITMRFVTNF